MDVFTGHCYDIKMREGLDTDHINAELGPFLSQLNPLIVKSYSFSSHIYVWFI
jgi:hypothetical protein